MAKIKNIRDLANELENGVEYCRLSKRLYRVVSLWIARKEIVLIDGVLRLVK